MLCSMRAVSSLELELPKQSKSLSLMSCIHHCPAYDAGVVVREGGSMVHDIIGLVSAIGPLMHLNKRLCRYTGIFQGYLFGQLICSISYLFILFSFLLFSLTIL